MELRRELAARAEGLRVRCAGVSMEPAVRMGEEVVVRAARGAAIRAGEVFLFEIAGGAFEMHRLVARLPGGWLVHRGDNQAVPDFGVTRVERVIGRVELPRVPPRRRDVARALVAMARRAPAAARRRLAR